MGWMMEEYLRIVSHYSPGVFTGKPIAGGVTTSYFEQVQNDTKITSAFNAVLERSEKEGVYMRDAAYMVAIDRVVKAMELRGWLNAGW